MKDYFQGKDWKYILKSSIVTFLSVMLPMLALQLQSVDISGVTPDMITTGAVASAFITLVRAVVIASVQALLLLFREKTSKVVKRK
jgi:hypothetical protein